MSVTNSHEPRTSNGSPVGTPVLQATDVTVRFGGLTALSNVSLAVPPGSIVGLVGPNGAGKSTMFGVLSGLVRPQTGRVTLHGTDISRLPAARRARLGLGRTFQHPQLFQSLTVREHLVLAYRSRFAPRRLWTDAITARPYRREDPAERERCSTVLDLLGITALADQSVAGLPLGTSRLVEIGRTLVREPEVILLDEPCSGLEHGETQRLAETLEVVRDHGIALLLVEHDVSLVMRLSTQVYVLDFGELIATGDAETVRTDPRVRAAYLGDGPAAVGEEA
jgi:ABC-type branched-subunit amino acid transport system ATPase component